MDESRPQGHYLHNVTYTYRERLVGTFVLTAALGLLVLMAINVTATNVFEEKIRLHAFLSDGKGIDTNTAVKISGIQAGRVVSLDIAEDNRVLVEMFIYKRYHERVRADALATVNRLSMLGVASIDITPGTIDSPMLADGSTIVVREPPSVDQMMESLAMLLDQSDGGDHETLIANLAEVATNLKTITRQVLEGEGAAGMLLYDEGFKSRLGGVVDSLNGLVASASQRIGQMEPIVEQGGELMTELHSATSGMVGLVAEVRESAVEARRMLAILSREMQSLPDFMVRADLLLHDADELIRTLERIWPVSSALDRPRDSALIEPQATHE